VVVGLPWSALDTATLIEMWQTHSASQIAKALERTRSSVCGKAGRLRAQGVQLAPNSGKFYAVPPHNIKKPEPTKRKRKPAAKAPARGLPNAVPGLSRPLPQSDQLALDPCTIDELNAFRCHWPLGPIDEVTRLYCGGKAYLPTPYCLHHVKRAYAKQPEKDHDRH